MERRAAVLVLDRLHEAQNELYAGGRPAAVRELLSPGVIWIVPGSSPIAGTYRGRDQVLAYFDRRRSIASDSFRMTRRDVLVGKGTTVAALTHGVATIARRQRRWSTVGLYEIVADRVASCRLLPLDPVGFDEIWSG